MKPVTIPHTADHAREPEGIPFVLTQAERSKAALYQAHLERNRRERNRMDRARSMGVSPEQVAA